MHMHMPAADTCIDHCAGRHRLRHLLHNLQHKHQSENHQSINYPAISQPSIQASRQHLDLREAHQVLALEHRPLHQVAHIGDAELQLQLAPLEEPETGRQVAACVKAGRWSEQQQAV